MKSLKDLALECCVTKFERVFLVRSDMGKMVCSLGKDVQLPPGMFEAIIKKAIEIERLLTPYHLMPCLAARRQLDWINVDLHYLIAYGNGGLLDEQDLEDMIGNLAPLRTLRICTRSMTTSILMRLFQIFDGLETLIVGDDDYICESSRFFNCQISASESYQVRLEQLRRLELNFENVPMSLLEADLTSLAQNLQVLKLYSFNLSGDITLEKADYNSYLLEKVVKQCKKLREFDFLNGYLSNIEGIIGAFYSLSDVESISILEVKSEYESTCYRLDLYCLFWFLSKLKTLKISGSSYSRQDVNKDKRLTVWDYGHCIKLSDGMNMQAVSRRGLGNSDLNVSISGSFEPAFMS